MSVTEALAAEFAARVHEIPGRYHHKVARLLIKAGRYLDPNSKKRGRLDRIPAPYICRGCQRAGVVERFEELGDLVAHRRAHFVADQVPAEQRRPVLAAVIQLDTRRRFGRVQTAQARR